MGKRVLQHDRNSNIYIKKNPEHITFKAKIERKEKPSLSATLSAPGVEQKGKHTLLISK